MSAMEILSPTTPVLKIAAVRFQATPLGGRFMDSQAFAEWLASLSLSEKIRVLALVYLAMTVNNATTVPSR
jgi:hypothetical protein